MEIRVYPDPVLRKRADEIQEIDGEVKKLAEQMIPIMYENYGVGLAAPQVGESVRLITVDVSETRDTPQVFVNPEIVEAKGRIKGEEGCLSIPGINADVERPKFVVLQAMNLEGEKLELEASGLFARVLSHEIDHLNGILFVDKVSPAKKIAIAKILKER